MIMKTVRFTVVLFLLLLFGWGVQPSKGFAETKVAETIPWSGWWWPYTSGGLATGLDYRGKPAPLEKYVMFKDGVAASSLIQWYKDRYYDSEAPYWYGLCYAWAAAATFEPEPLYPSSVDNIVFRVGDKKGLLTLAHQQDLREHDSCADPTVLHYWLLYYLGEMERAFVADLDAGEEIWSYPVYKYDMQVVDSGPNKLVEVVVYYADDLVEPDYLGCKNRTERYEYELDCDSDGIITGGRWLGSSIDVHPDSFTFVLAANCTCDQFDYQAIKDLAATRDDYLESDGLEEIQPGSYNLILLNDDLYEFNLAENEILWLDLSMSDGGEEDIKYELSDVDNEIVASGILHDSDGNRQIVLTAEMNPPYRLSLAQKNYDSSNIYTLKYDRRATACNFKLPYLPKNGMWTGFSITNPGSSSVNRASLVGYDADGLPVATLWGPEKIDPFTKKTLVVDNLSCFTVDWIQIEQLRLIADENLEVVTLSGNGDLALSGIGKHIPPNSHLVIPDTSSSMGALEYVWGGVCSNSSVEQEINLSLYNSEGCKFSNKVLTLEPGAKMKVDSSIFSRDMPNDGWVEAWLTESESLSNDNVGICGYLVWRKGRVSADMMRALPVESSSLWLAQLTERGFWQTSVIMVNVNGEDIRIRIESTELNEYREIPMRPYQRKEVDLLELFAGVDTKILCQSAFKFSSDASFCGYANYQGDADYVSLPLINDNLLTSVLILPHVAVGAGWWTGVSVFNPQQETISVKIIPTHIDGYNWDDEIRNLSITGGGRKCFALSNLWALGTIEKISYITIESANNESIGGFYLYGNQINGGPLKSLAGSNM